MNCFAFSLQHPRSRKWKHFKGIFCSFRVMGELFQEELVPEAATPQWLHGRGAVSGAKCFD